MLKLLAGENFDNTILRGLLRRLPDIDIIRVQDTELYGANDSTVLAWAAQENRILLTHDVATPQNGNNHVSRIPRFDRISQDTVRWG